MRFEIAKFKSFNGHEGLGFNATLIVDGAKGCDAIDDGNGGGVTCYWASQEVKNKVLGHIKTLPLEPLAPDAPQWERDMWPNGMKHDLDSFLTKLVSDYENDKRFRRLCKAKTVYRLAGDKAGQYRVLNAPYEPTGRGYLSKLEQKPEEVLNEKYA